MGLGDGHADGGYRESRLSEIEVSRMAQYFYEEAKGFTGFRLVINMTGKPDLVDALKKALARIDQFEAASREKSDGE